MMIIRTCKTRIDNDTLQTAAINRPVSVVYAPILIFIIYFNF